MHLDAAYFHIFKQISEMSPLHSRVTVTTRVVHEEPERSSVSLIKLGCAEFLRPFRQVSFLDYDFECLANSKSDS